MAVKCGCALCGAIIEVGEPCAACEAAGVVGADSDARPRCATCKSWQAFRPGVGVRANADERRLGLCGKIGQENEGHAEALDMAQVTDLSGCAGFRTAAEFGCVLHEPKPQ